MQAFRLLASLSAATRPSPRSLLDVGRARIVSVRATGLVKWSLTATTPMKGRNVARTEVGHCQRRGDRICTAEANRKLGYCEEGWHCVPDGCCRDGDDCGGASASGSVAASSQAVIGSSNPSTSSSNPLYEVPSSIAPASSSSVRKLPRDPH